MLDRRQKKYGYALKVQCNVPTKRRTIVLDHITKNNTKEIPVTEKYVIYNNKCEDCDGKIYDAKMGDQ